jgi:hypothetical protein
MSTARSKFSMATVYTVKLVHRLFTRILAETDMSGRTTKSAHGRFMRILPEYGSACLQRAESSMVESKKLSHRPVMALV